MEKLKVCKLVLAGAAALFLLFAPKLPVSAEELTPVVNRDGQAREITIKAREESGIGAVYLKWDNPVSPYQIRTDQGLLDCGEYGFLHEFIPLDGQSGELTVLLPEQKMGLYEVRIFTDAEVPEDVQVWQPPCERADIMLVSAHSDDEILFMGGIIPTYGAERGARVQVVYMTEFWSTAPVREHEKLDGLWTDGLRNYPVCGGFRDVYAGDRAQAEQLYDLQAMTDYLTDEIRRFRPQVVVTHDFDGEYGHGFHQLTAAAVADALEDAADEACRTDTEVYAERGAWNVPKAYFHLYGENAIRMDLNAPLESFGGRTALEVAKEAYLKHVSQQWCWFYVSDAYQYSCADFGLYRTGVGYDTGNDMLEHLTLYGEQEEQERLAAEQERIRQEQERLEQEKRERERQEALRMEREAREREQAERLAEEARQTERIQGARRVCLGIAAVSLAILATILGMLAHRRKGRRGKTERGKKG